MKRLLTAAFLFGICGFLAVKAAESGKLDYAGGSAGAQLEARNGGVSYLPDYEEERETAALPKRYDLREVIEIPGVPDQGNFGTCWAFASLLALETSMPPELRTSLSADHMSIKNSFSLGQNDGGEYSMSMAYLLAWQGPVAESEDPYGDGISPDGLKPVCHVQEIRILPENDRERIKRAVYETGGVQSSLYIPMEKPKERERYYREDTHSLNYNGNQEPNHDVVILGWDDNYSKENFQVQPKQDGAFLCMNSWGSGFGDGGCFYVSYEDTRLGIHNVLYSGVEKAGRYDRIYQTDLCGWTGQLGYGKTSAWFTNVYEAGAGERLAAAGFYATMEHTSYRIYTALDLPEKNSGIGKISTALAKRTPVAEGTLEEAGFYTIPFPQEIPVKTGSRFAVIVEIDTPGAAQPVAIEYRAGKRTESVDIADGEGYISFNGNLWKRAESEENCNLCLKVYSRK